MAMPVNRAPVTVSQCMLQSDWGLLQPLLINPDCHQGTEPSPAPRALVLSGTRTRVALGRVWPLGCASVGSFSLALRPAPCPGAGSLEPPSLPQGAHLRPLKAEEAGGWDGAEKGRNSNPPVIPSAGSSGCQGNLFTPMVWPVTFPQDLGKPGLEESPSALICAPKGLMGSCRAGPTNPSFIRGAQPLLSLLLSPGISLSDSGVNVTVGVQTGKPKFERVLEPSGQLSTNSEASELKV